MVQVNLNHIVKAYDAQDAAAQGGRQNALQDVTLMLPDGEILAVVGPSGCGKSTLLKVIAGLEYATSGSVLYNGHDVTQVEPQQRGVGMVFQDYALYPVMKGKGNLSYYFEVHQRSEEEAEQHMREVSELMGVGFEHLLGQMPTTLSGGEQQRVAIARCIVRRPTVFLMDEPICNLDAKLRERTRIEMKRLLQRYKVTTVYVTHDQQEAIFMGDKIAVMREGRLEQIGSFDDLYYTPANLFVASFIGTPPIAVIPLRADAGYGWALPPQISEVVRREGQVRLGVRPESWAVSASDTEGASFAVRYIERNPSMRAAFLHGRLGEANVSVVVPLDYPDVLEVRLTPKWDEVHVFSATTEAALHAPGVPELF
jgi:ABC-type sugar transport system ATPase subunit